jgi:hypothetical protein
MGSSSPAAAGISSPGTSTAPARAHSAQTESRLAPAPALDSLPEQTPTTTSPVTSNAASARQTGIAERVKIHAPAEHMIALVPSAVMVEAIDAHTSFANVGSDNAHELALWLGLIDADFEAGDDPELADQLRRRCARAAG